MPTTEGSKTTEILMALLMKAIGLAILIFAMIKVPAGPLQNTLIEMSMGLIGVAGGAYILGRSVRKIGQPVQTPPGDDAEAAKVVAAVK